MVESARSRLVPPAARKRLSRILFVLIGIALLVAIAGPRALGLFECGFAQRGRFANPPYDWACHACAGPRGLCCPAATHVSIDDVSFTDPTGALRIDAHYLKGYVRLAALLTGRIEISSATLGQPDMRIDLDGRPMRRTA